MIITQTRLPSFGFSVGFSCSRLFSQVKGAAILFGGTHSHENCGAILTASLRSTPILKTKQAYIDSEAIKNNKNFLPINS